jgi:hypothetical protein
MYFLGVTDKGRISDRDPMKARVLLIAALAFVALPSAAETPRPKLSCPAVAPADWGLTNAPLAEVQVLATPEHEAIDETATPSLVPDENVIRDGVLRQTWQMNSNGPGWLWYVDCRYRGSKRVLRLDAKGLSRCLRTITPFSKTSGETPRSVQRMACD